MNPLELPIDCGIAGFFHLYFKHYVKTKQFMGLIASYRKGVKSHALKAF